MRMYKTRLVMCLIGMSLCGTSLAQNVERDSLFFNRILKRFNIRNTFDEDASKVTPAQLMFTKPKGVEKSYLIDGALGYTLADVINYTAKAVVEYHKNTMVEKEQDNFSFGYSGLYYTTKNPINVMLTHNIAFVDDGRKSDRSLVFVGNFSLYSVKNKLRLNAPGYIGGRFTYLLTPNVGTELQQVLKSSEDGREGNIFRGTADLSGALAFRKYNPDPINTTASRIFQLTFGYTLRCAFSDGTSTNERKTELLKAGADFYIVDDNDKQVSLGIAFKKGSNPLKGLSPQQYWQLSMNFQL